VPLVAPATPCRNENWSFGCETFEFWIKRNCSRGLVEKRQQAPEAAVPYY
jgi:hypothetical protein